MNGDEKNLVQRLKEGQEEAYRTLVREYQSKLFNVAYGISLDREESLDIIQEVFLKVFDRIRTFEGRSGLYTWLRRITINESLNWRRRWKRRLRWKHQPLETEDGQERPETGTENNGPETLYYKKELEKNLVRELKRLPDDARAVFILREVDGLSYEDIAKLLNIKKGTVSSRIFYAREKLKQSLAIGTKNE